MVDILGVVIGGLSLATATIKFGEVVGEAISSEDRRMSNKLAFLVGKIHSASEDIEDVLTKAKRARGRESKSLLHEIALRKSQKMQQAVVSLIRLLTRIWSKPSLGEKIIRWIKNRGKHR